MSSYCLQGNFSFRMEIPVEFYCDAWKRAVRAIDSVLRSAGALAGNQSCRSWLYTTPQDCATNNVCITALKTDLRIVADLGDDEDDSDKCCEVAASRIAQALEDLPFLYMRVDFYGCFEQTEPDYSGSAIIDRRREPVA